ncbi:MAG: hypothetical protein AB1762_07600 [Gemmatimonadota bacterium]
MRVDAVDRKRRTRPDLMSGSIAFTKKKRSFSRKSAAAVGKSRIGLPDDPYVTIGMYRPSRGERQPKMCRGSAGSTYWIAMRDKMTRAARLSYG